MTAWCTALVFCTGCDILYANFINTLPIEGGTQAKSTIYVYVGLDGVPYDLVKESQSQDFFPDDQWSISSLITMFPATSDSSWSRLMHTSKLPSYEYQYYDSGTDTLVNDGSVGLFKHVIPPVADGLDTRPAYMYAFDFWASDYFHTFDAYRYMWYNYGRSLDSFFQYLHRAGQTQGSVTGYFLETDVCAHTKTRADLIKMLEIFYRRIQRFKALHPEQTYLFTLMADHGNDFIKVPNSHLLQFEDELEGLGITATKGFDAMVSESADDLFAIPIVHTRVTYISLYTQPQMIEPVALRVSTLESVDLVTSQIARPLGFDGDPTTEFFAIWASGELSLVYGYVPESDHYILFPDQNYTRFDLSLPFESDDAYEIFSDETLFALTRHRAYPDMFYRIRTGLTGAAVEHPADILVSFSHSYASIGFEIPGGANEIASASFHGALDATGSTGVLLTEERVVPSSIRIDTVLGLFPKMSEHLRQKGIELSAGDPGEDLDYDNLINRDIW
jgi:hypothetical protein